MAKSERPSSVDVGGGVVIQLPIPLPADEELAVKEPTTEHAKAWRELGREAFFKLYQTDGLPVLYGCWQRGAVLEAVYGADTKKEMRNRQKLPRALTVLFVGPSGCGKDEAGQWFSENTRLEWKQSMSAYGLPFFARAMQQPGELVYEHRHKIRTAFRYFMDGFRHYVPDYFVRLALNDGDVITGIRSYPEFVAARVGSLIDQVIWIERAGVKPDPTLEITAKDCLATIYNDGTLAEFHAQLGAVAEALYVWKS